MTRSLITGACGQDGYYLAKHLITLGHEVIVTARSGPRLQAEYEGMRVRTAILDVTDSGMVRALLKATKPDHIYNLAAQSHVGLSYASPESTAAVNYGGVLNLLEAIRGTDIKMYQASTSEMFGNSDRKQNERTPMEPESPYAIAKTAAHNLCEMYRRSYGVFVACGILFNHESPRRPDFFLPRKVAKGLVEIVKGKREKLRLGNPKAYRDWGWAPEYVTIMPNMLEMGRPYTMVIGTGEAASVRDLVFTACQHLGIHHKMDQYVEWKKTEKRPSEVDFLRADITRAKSLMGWKPQYKMSEVIRMLIRHEEEVQDEDFQKEEEPEERLDHPSEYD